MPPRLGFSASGETKSAGSTSGPMAGLFPAAILRTQSRTNPARFSGATFCPSACRRQVCVLNRDSAQFLFMRVMRACVLALVLAIKPSDFFGASAADGDAGAGVDEDVCASAAVAMIRAAPAPRTKRESDVARTMLSSTVITRCEKLTAADRGNPAE